MLLSSMRKVALRVVDVMDGLPLGGGGDAPRKTFSCLLVQVSSFPRARLLVQGYALLPPHFATGVRLFLDAGSGSLAMVELPPRASAQREEIVAHKL